jgi:predicted nucleotidyltransferase
MGNATLQLDTEAIADFCRKWRVREMSLFGSALREDFGPASDLDFLVSFEPGVSLDIDQLLEMKEELEGRFGRPVDLVEKEALRNPWRKHEILTTRRVLYAA